MKKTFVIQVEYPDCDFVSSDEIMEVTQECIENHLERYFGANIMDGDYDRIKVKEVTDFIELVKRMREAQVDQEIISARLMYIREHKGILTDKDFSDIASITNKVIDLESEVDEYLKKMEE